MSMVLTMFLVYHSLECFNHIIELIQMSEGYHMPNLNFLFSLNGLYGVGIFIYAHFITYVSLQDCSFPTSK